MPVVLWAGLRQLEAVRFSTFLAISQGTASGVMNSADLSHFEEWVSLEVLNGEWTKWSLRTLDPPESTDNLTLPPKNALRFNFLWNIVNTFCHPDVFRVVGEGTRTTEKIAPDNDFGVGRSNAGWLGRWENFVTTSAMIRFLGALEQFEFDALKGLLFYRPLGHGTQFDSTVEQSVEEDVIREHPETRGGVEYYTKPPLWTFIRKTAVDPHERRQIFSSVYGINLENPDQFGWTLDELWEKRNAIAHGRDEVEITIGALLKIHNYVIKSMLNLTDQIRDQYRLEL